MTLITRPDADMDIDHAADWLEARNAGSGRQILLAVRTFFADLPQQPRRFSRLNRPPRGREVRQGLIPGFLFLVTYEVTPAQLVVWSVGHAKARSQPWRRRMAP